VVLNVEIKELVQKVEEDLNAKNLQMVGLKKVLINRLVALDQELKEVSTTNITDNLSDYFIWNGI